MIIHAPALDGFGGQIISHCFRINVTICFSVKPALSSMSSVWKERIFHSLRALIFIPAFLPRSHLDQFEMCWLWTPSKVEHAPKLWLLYFSKGFAFLWIHHLGLGPKPLAWLDMCAICESENAKTDRMGKCVREAFKYCLTDFVRQMDTPTPPLRTKRR